MYQHEPSSFDFDLKINSQKPAKPFTSIDLALTLNLIARLGMYVAFKAAGLKLNAKVALVQEESNDQRFYKEISKQ
jgi:hypothetical protein